jgi:hypothetical protein
MAYNIVKSDGTPLVTVNDGQTNNVATSLTLVGKNFAGYGTFLNENFIKLLENFASGNRPQYPLTGQLWYQTSTKLLQVFNGDDWKSISGAQALADEPIYKVSGDLWFDSVNQQLKVWTGSSWIVIGPSFTSTTGTSGAVADTVIDSSQFTHVVVKFFVQNQLIGILSKDAAFQPAVNIPGFSSIKPGFNLARGRTPELLFYENANNAAFLGGLAASTYLTKDNAQLTSKLIVQSTDGIEIQEPDGITTNFQIFINNNNTQLVSQVRGNGLLIRTRPDNYAGTLQTVLAVDKVTGLITVLNDPTDPAGVATKNYVDNRDNTTRSYLASNVSLLYGNISTNLANATIVYGNVRSTQSELGFNNPGVVPAASDISIGGTHAFAYQRVTTGTTMAGNLVTLWANVSAIHANVLSNPGVAGSATASMFSNVRAIQGQITALQGDSLRRDGATTITGVLRPDTPNDRDLGTAASRFAGFFANTANVSTITNLQSINNSGPRTGFDPFLIRGNPISLTGNIRLVNPTDLSANTNLGFMHAITIEGGVDTRGHITTKQANVFNLGSTLNWFDTIYVENIVSKNIAGNLSGAGGASLGRTTFAGNIEPTLDLQYGIGGNNKRWLNVQADEFIGRYVTLQSTGIFVGATASSEALDIGTSSGKRFRDVYAQEFYGTGVEVRTTGIFTTGTAVDIGTNSNKFKDVYATNFYGRATQAQYADLAERFHADAEYAPGTVVVLGGSAEITAATDSATDDVFGVISTDPAYLMNSDAGGNATHPPVAMAGRVPVRVTGIINKNDRLVVAGNGVARAATREEITPFNVIGRALESKTTEGEATIEAIVKVSM